MFVAILVLVRDVRTICATRYAAGALVMCLLLTPVWADQTQADLTVHVSGFAHERGQALASLFRDGDDIFSKPYIRLAAKIQQGKATFVFRNVVPGNYAVTAFHDENGNNDLDHNFLRLPAEPLGFTNGFKLSMFSGMPSFEKLRFAFMADSKPLEILLSNP